MCPSKRRNVQSPSEAPDQILSAVQELRTQDDLPGKTRVFLSYSRHDNRMATWLRKELEAAGFEVFRDIESTLPGEEWWRRLSELIALADAIVYLMSPRSCASKVCVDEVEYSRTLNKRIFPAMIKTVDWREVPEGLAKIHSVYLTDPEKRESSVAKLVAAVQANIGWVREHTRLFDRARQWQAKGRSLAELLTGPALDEAERWLTQRPTLAEAPTNLHHDYITASRDAERAEQQQRLRESEEQRKILEEQRNRAEASFRAGLDVISGTQESIIESLSNTKGVTLATREKVTSILLQATERLKKANPDFYSSNVHMQFTGNEMHATASLAQIYIEQGEFSKAEATAKRAIELAESYYKDEYNPLQRRPGLHQIATLLASLGDIKFRQNKFEEAIKYLQDSVTLRERGVEYYSKSSDAADFRMALADALQRLSVVSLVSGSNVKALEAAERALELTEVIAATNPEDSPLRMTLAAMLNSVGDGLFVNGMLSEAKEKFQASYAIFDEMLKESPDNLFLIRWKSICLERFGNIKMEVKDFVGAARFFEEALGLKQQLVDADSSNTQFQEDFETISRKFESATRLAKRSSKERIRDKS
jgi:tetratricopeptide (TPR) repeat protein